MWSLTGLFTRITAFTWGTDEWCITPVFATVGKAVPLRKFRLNNSPTGNAFLQLSIPRGLFPMRKSWRERVLDLAKTCITSSEITVNTSANGALLDASVAGRYTNGCRYQAGCYIRYFVEATMQGHRLQRRRASRCSTRHECPLLPAAAIQPDCIERPLKKVTAAIEA
jgi:hypothetical protein